MIFYVARDRDNTPRLLQEVKKFAMTGKGKREERGRRSLDTARAGGFRRLDRFRR